MCIPMFKKIYMRLWAPIIPRLFMSHFNFYELGSDVSRRISNTRGRRCDVIEATQI